MGQAERLGYFSVTVKHQAKVTYRRKGLFQRDKKRPRHNREHGHRQVGMVMGQLPRAPMIHKQEAEHIGSSANLWKSQSPPHVTPSSNKATSPNPSQTLLPAGNKYSNT